MIRELGMSICLRRKFLLSSDRGSIYFCFLLAHIYLLCNPNYFLPSGIQEKNAIAYVLIFYSEPYQ